MILYSLGCSFLVFSILTHRRWRDPCEVITPGRTRLPVASNESLAVSPDLVTGTKLGQAQLASQSTEQSWLRPCHIPLLSSLPTWGGNTLSLSMVATHPSFHSLGNWGSSHCAHVSPPLQLALDYGIKFMETSAKANINVENVSPVHSCREPWACGISASGREGLSFGRVNLEDPGLASGSGRPLLGTQDTFSLTQQMRESKLRFQYLDPAVFFSATLLIHIPSEDPGPSAMP